MLSQWIISHHLVSVSALAKGQSALPMDHLPAPQEARSLMVEIVMRVQGAVGELPPVDELGHARDESLDAVNRIVAVFPAVSFPKNAHVDHEPLLVECVDDLPGSLLMPPFSAPHWHDAPHSLPKC